MLNSLGASEYMIIILCIAFFCIVFSGFVKKLLLCGLRGILGLGAVFILNTFLKGTGLVLGINLFNGIVIGLLGLPAFIGLYIIRLFTL